MEHIIKKLNQIDDSKNTWDNWNLEERKQFVDLSLRPIISAIEGRLSMDDITNSQNYVKFNLDETFLRSDAMTRLAIIEKMLALNLITLDQAKAMEDLTPNGDTSNAS